MGGSVDELEDSPTNVPFQDVDVVMEEAQDLSGPRTRRSYRVQDEHDEHDESDFSTQGDSNQDAQDDDDSDDLFVNNTRGQRRSVNRSLQKSSRQFPIEVVLRPPPNPNEYERIEPSLSVARLLEEIEGGDEDFYYNVEFDDGHIEQVAYDDLQELENGPRAAQQFQTPQVNQSLAGLNKPTSKRPLPDDDIYNSGSDYSYSLKGKRKLPIKPTRNTSRRMSKQPSNRASVNDDHEVNGGSSSGYGGRAKSSKPVAHHPFAERITRFKNPAWRKRIMRDDSEDELARGPHYDYDDDTTPVIRSNVGGATKATSRKKRKAQSLGASSKYVDDISEIEFEQTRRPKRTTRVSKSMRDPEMDDEYEAVEDAAALVPKIAAIKENFEDVLEESDFGNVHSTVCETCNTVASLLKGPLIPCQGCSYSYHKQCIGNRSQRDHRVTKVGPNHFVLQCRFCIGSQKKDKRAPTYSMCQTCKIPGVSCAEFSAKRTPKQEEKARLENGGEDPVIHVESNLMNNPDVVLFRCSTCRRAYHIDHLPPMNSDPINDESIRTSCLGEYSLAGWNCKDCLEAKHKIHALVAWRPADQSAYLSGQPDDKLGSDEIEYLVKWDGRSHLHDVWMPGAWVYGIAAAAMRTAFHKREGNEFPKMTTESAVEEEWLVADLFLGVKYRLGSTAFSIKEDLARISDVVSVFVKFQGLSYEEAVWDEPPPRESTVLWDAFSAAYEEYINGKYFPSANDQRMRERIRWYRSLDFRKECELKNQPPGLKEGRTLMDYQMEGVNWLLYNFHQQQNVILADEMGLGKTIQIVSFVNALVQDKPKCWPFLIVVPNATCPNWRRELKDWAPALRVVTYHGGKASQDLAYRHELFPNGPKDGMKAHVVIMSFEAAGTVKTAFQTVKWAGLIVDEGQRLKNEETQLYRTLVEMNIPCRILLTGTPLQNNKRELFNLLQFIDPKNDAESLDTKYSELTKENLPELHNLIRPYFLRRTKVQVLKFLPPMAQVIVPVTMTVLQEKLSKSIIARNPELIKAIISKGKMKASDRKNLSNIIADLRQCLCHPFCFNDNVEDKTVDDEQMRRNLIAASPKFMLLEIMLPKLRQRGHRVLIFSQFLRCLDIIEDLLNMLGLQYGRIDGNLSALKKQKQIDNFNAPDSPLFAMLLSTRAGGVGINLATADTVIIYDPDWNPHQDIQAISRAHRIGQREKVLCFQLTTKDTIEENIMQAGRKKMALDHALIESLDAQDDTSRDLESILKQGAESLFSNKDKVRITYDSASVDKLLDRSQVESTSADDNTAETQFSIARVWANDTGALTGNLDTGDNSAPAADASVWERILRAREEEHQRDLAAKQEVYGRGARRRGTQGVDYKSNRLPGPDSGGSDVDVEDELYIDIEPIDADDDDDEAYIEGQPLSKSKGVKVPAAAEHNQAIAMARQLATEAIEPVQTASHHVNQLQQPAPVNPTMQHAPLRHPPVQAWAAPVISRPTSQVPILPPQRPPSEPISQPFNINPNLVVPLPHREQHLANIARSTSTIPLPTSTSRVLKSTQIPPPTQGRPPNRPSTNLTILPTTEEGSCFLCRTVHPPNKTCVDLNSEISLRVAIDLLRASGDRPNVQAYRDMLINQLRRLAGR
ncbi:PHD/FYVE-zinc-finger like domain-containing protein [Jackrogersella minutella]|nr:PHD/FYVE-zinc-finger like domain-containing protein [Jackrogersella minutella]